MVLSCHYYFTPKFTAKDYFWPIRETEMTRNTNLDQNPDGKIQNYLPKRGESFPVGD